MLDEQKPGGCLKAVVSIGLIMLFIGWVVLSVISHDPFFFLNTISGEVNEVIVYKNGVATTLKPGDPRFERIVNAVHGEAGKIVAASQGGISEPSVERLRNRDVALEVRYKDHGWVHNPVSNLGIFDVLLIPIVSSEADSQLYYTGYHGVWIARAPQISIESQQKIRDALVAAGF